MVNFGLLMAEICWRVWGTPANFNGFCVLAALLHSTLVVGVSQTLWHWTEGSTYIRQGGHHVGHLPTFLVIVGLIPCQLKALQQEWTHNTVTPSSMRTSAATVSVAIDNISVWVWVDHSSLWPRAYLLTTTTTDWFLWLMIALVYAAFFGKFCRFYRVIHYVDSCCRYWL